jgi:hypothetical protein
MFDAVGLVVGFLLTILVLSYLLGDNFAYRLVLHLFTGALMGYTFAIVIHEVLFKMVLGQLGTQPIIVVPVLIGLALFFFKSIRRLAYIGNFFMAFLIGVGVALALLGALLGTLVPQLGATASALRPDPQNTLWPLVKGLIIVGGTIFTLFAFDFTLSQQQIGLAGTLGGFVRFLGSIGRIFVTVALGVAFAGALTASLSFFIGRIQYLFEVLKGF